MRKLLTSLAAVSALTLAVSAAQAACNGHDVMASTEKSKEAVAISTYDGATAPDLEQVQEPTEASTTPVCAEGEKDCDPATK